MLLARKEEDFRWVIIGYVLMFVVCFIFVMVVVALWKRGLKVERWLGFYHRDQRSRYRGLSVKGLPAGRGLMATLDYHCSRPVPGAKSYNLCASFGILIRTLEHHTEYKIYREASTASQISKESRQAFLSKL